MAATQQRRRITAHEKRIVGARAGWRCEACGCTLEATYECDHEIPLHLGGADELSNLRAKCLECHRRKTMLEEIARLKANASSVPPAPAPPREGGGGVVVLKCARCERTVSPYFTHKCEQRPLAKSKTREEGLTPSPPA